MVPPRTHCNPGFSGWNGLVSSVGSTKFAGSILIRLPSASVDGVGEVVPPLDPAQAEDASHDLRSPLAVIRAEIEIDLAHPDRADPLATNRRLLRSIDRLQRLTNDLLVLARSDSSVPDGHSAAVLDLDDVVRTEVELVRRSARVPVDTSRVSAAQVRGDDEGMGRLVVNLLDNAVRHASTAVTVELAEDGGRAVLAVVDDGPGIAEADRTRIFERFVRLDDARRSDGRNGLGLAIVAEIAARHGGTVEVDPLHDPGARIVVSMPVATP